MNAAGYKEIEHTADLELKVWAMNFDQLLVEAAKGMYSIMEIQLSVDNIQQREILIDALDGEMLLVSFLSELLFFIEDEELAFNKFLLNITDYKLTGTLEGGKIANNFKEIKAVTYHNLKIIESKGLYTVHIVFDV